MKDRSLDRGTESCNRDPDRVTNADAEFFIRQIETARSEGFGFLPFIGAGLSAASGAPVIAQVHTYLRRCIAMSVGATDPSQDAMPGRRWNPRTDQWPTFLGTERKTLTDDPSTEAVRRHIERRKPQVHHGYQMQDDEYPILQEALGAMSEWRSSLLFLSRITSEQRRDDDKAVDILAMDTPKAEIIDAFFREALKGKSPSLGHRMLALLAGALRLDLLLTTNFDDLLERAFASSRNPLQVCDVQLGGELPSWELVADVPSLIKLHGNRHALRADYSLDAVPTESDRQHFVEYLLADRGSIDPTGNGLRRGSGFQNHLLVIGHSVAERRSRALIEHAWRTLPKDFCVFWICHSKHDEERVKAFTMDFFRRNTARGLPHAWRGSCLIRYPDAGLLLLQLYQTLRHTLPPQQGLFPSASRLPLPPLCSPRPGETGDRKDALPSLKTFEEALVRKIRDVGRLQGGYRFVAVTSQADTHGVTTASANVFRALEEGRESTCLWLDMNEISSADNLFETLLDAAYCRLGIDNWIPCHVAGRKESPRADEIRRVVKAVSPPWVIFLNARETPGANTLPVNPEQSPECRNGWLSKPQTDASTDTDTTEAFIELVVDLCRVRPDEHRMTVVLLCRELDRDPALRSGLVRYGLANHEVRLETSDLTFQEGAIAEAAIAWANGDVAKRQFLHALILMQRPRPLATIWSPAVSAGAHPSSAAAADFPRWLDELEGLGLVRRKAGGFIWIHSRCRDRIRHALRGPQAPPADATLGVWRPSEDEAAIHDQLAQWYMKMLDSTHAAAAVFEIAYHFCVAARSRLVQSPQDGMAWSAARIRAATAFLNTHRFLIQTRSYSRESLRRLEFIRDTLCGPKVAALHAVDEDVRTLRILCSEVMRAVAREVGEEQNAYLRQWQIAQLLLRREPSWTPARSDDDASVTGPLRRAMASDESVDQLQRLRWWKWLGILGIASRDFDAAEQALRRASFDAIRASGGTAPRLEPAAEATLDICEWLNGALREETSPSGRFASVRLELLRILEQYVYLQVLKRRVALRLQGLAQPHPSREGPVAIARNETHEAQWDDIRRLIESAQLLASRIRNSDDSPGAYDTVHATWCLSRLLIHMSYCNLGMARSSSMTQTAMALLGDAEACLRVSDPQRHRSELALIDLHRADSRLRLAESHEIRWAAPALRMTLASFCRQFEEKEPTPHPVPNRRMAADDARLKSAPLNLGKVASYVRDGLRFLSRSEPVLLDRRRNVAWIGWFFERKLRAIALSVWLSIYEPDRPIPFLGLEAAPGDGDTAADLLLSQSEGLIRIDAYRLATLIDAYTSCVKALQVRVWLETSVDPAHYRTRMKKMHARLSLALLQLDHVVNARNALRTGGDGEMAGPVRAYIERVQARTRVIADAHFQEL